MNKVISIIKYVFLAVSLLSVFSLVFLGEDGGTSVMLVWTYILLGITLALALIFPLINLVTNPKGAMNSLIGLAIVVVVLVVSYALSSDAPVVNSAGGFFTDPTTLKITDVALYTTYFALAAAVIGVIFGELRNSLK